MASAKDGVERQVVVCLDVTGDDVVDIDGLIRSGIPVLIARPSQLGHPVQSADSAADSPII